MSEDTVVEKPASRKISKNRSEGSPSKQSKGESQKKILDDPKDYHVVDKSESQGLHHRKDPASYINDAKKSSKSANQKKASFNSSDPKFTPKERHYSDQPSASTSKQTSTTTKIEEHSKDDLDNGFGPSAKEVPDPSFYTRENNHERIVSEVKTSTTIKSKTNTDSAVGSTAAALTAAKAAGGVKQATQPHTSSNTQVDYTSTSPNKLEENVSRSLPDDYLADSHIDGPASVDNYTGKRAADRTTTTQQNAEPSFFEKVSSQLQGEFEKTRDEMSRMTGFSKNTAKFAVNTGKIAYYESLLNLKLKSKAAALGAAALPLAYLAWVGLSLTIALFVGEIFSSAALGALAFTLVQAGAIAFILGKRKNIQQKTNMSHTKESLEAYRHAYRGENHPGQGQVK